MYGFKGTGDMFQNPFFEISTAYPGMESIYSFVAGLFYLIPFSFAGMSLNLLKPGFNKTALMAGLVALAGSTVITQGLVNSMGLFIIMRIIHACFFSTINPLLFATVAEYFPDNQRARANAAI